MGSILTYLGTMILLGGIMVLLMIVRTALEDRSLQEELPGYREYAQRV